MSNDTRRIARLEIDHISKVFPKEARDFTTWLEEHVEALADRLNIKLSVVQREKSVGDFNVDLWCEDGDGNAVVIENQLDRTNHDHLGKLLTYLVNLDAATAIWVTSDPRLEHQKVIDWLNESTPANISFYLIKAEAVHIGDSAPAPLFTVAAGPDAQIKQAGLEKKEWAERHVKRFEFWKGLLERSRGRTQLFSTVSPGRENWISTGAGKSGIQFAYVVLLDSAQVELYIDHDTDTGEKNKVIFGALYRNKDAIEQEFGAHLDWQRLDDKRACRIAKRVGSGGLKDTQIWPDLQDEMIDAMIRLNQVFRPRIGEIKV